MKMSINIEWGIRKRDGKSFLHIGSWFSCSEYFKDRNVDIDRVAMNNHPIYEIEEIDGE
jgi:hypothetical protein